MSEDSPASPMLPVGRVSEVNLPPTQLNQLQNRSSLAPAVLCISKWPATPQKSMRSHSHTVGSVRVRDRTYLPGSLMNIILWFEDAATYEGRVTRTAPASPPPTPSHSGLVRAALQMLSQPAAIKTGQNRKRRSKRSHLQTSGASL